MQIHLNGILDSVVIMETNNWFPQLISYRTWPATKEQTEMGFVSSRLNKNFKRHIKLGMYLLYTLAYYKNLILLTPCLKALKTYMI